jgi:hypothetical protein
MGENFDQLPSHVQDHIKVIASDFNLPEGEDTLDSIAGGWLEKKSTFEEKVAEQDMEEVDVLEKDDEKGGIALTYSGSLVSIGPLVDGVRSASYSSIGFRTSAPDAAENDNSVLKKDVKVDETIEFSTGPVKSTSRIFKIAVFIEDLSVEEQEENLSEVTSILEDEFVEINKTVIME